MVSQNFVLIKVFFLCDQVVFFLFDQVYSFIVGDFDSNECHFKWAIPGLFLLYFSSFQTIYCVKNLDFSWIWTRIVRIEGEHADHLTPTTAHECCFNEEHNRLSKNPIVIFSRMCWLNLLQRSPPCYYLTAKTLKG